MKTSDRNPSELIDYIGDIIREREQKSLPTFYTISIEQFEKTTPVAEKEEGYENYKRQVLKYMSDYNLTSITIQLFSGKSRNVKHPFQSFKVPLKKQNPMVMFSGADKDPLPEVQQLESAVPVGRYYDEKFEWQMRIMKTEMEKQTLLERINHLTERYEDRIQEQERMMSEKLNLLQKELDEKNEELREFEEEIARYEKGKHDSFGNIALGSIGSRMVENLAKSDFGTGVLKGLLGKEGYATLQGHLAGIENEQHSIQEPSARIITEQQNPKDPRQVALSYIQKMASGLSDMHLRLLYDIVELTEKNQQDLQVLWNIVQQIKKQREKQKTSVSESSTAPESGENTNTEQQGSSSEEPDQIE